jgi:hypothetical protein
MELEVLAEVATVLGAWGARFCDDAGVGRGVVATVGECGETRQCGGGEGVGGGKNVGLMMTSR